MIVKISNGNKKMGHIPSVSLPPVTTCASGCKCAQKCYARKMCAYRKYVRNAYNHNLDVYNNHPDAYWKEMDCVLYSNRFFRFHVSGDISDYRYLKKMVEVVTNNPHCQVLVFTKKYGLVNTYLRYHTLPDNLHLIFSAWPGMKMNNPHNLPVAQVVFKGKQPDKSWKKCGVNCYQCTINNDGCWTLKNGETMYFNEH